MSSRFLPNTPGFLTVSPDPENNLIRTLQVLIADYPPASSIHNSSSGLYHGPLSVSYLFLSLAPLYPLLTIGESSLLEWSEKYLSASTAVSHPQPAQKPGKWGVSDESMVRLALRACLTQEERLVERFCAAATSVAALDVLDETNEWLYGRAGYLYLLRLLASSFPSPSPVHALLKTAAEELIERILAAPRPWTWHGKAYTGAVHGVMSIVTQIVLTSPSRAQAVQPELEQLLLMQRESGNWPSSLPDSGDDRLVQFCHGAPGMVVSLLALRAYFPNLEARIDRAIERGRKCIWERGLLTKEPGLCHGIVGNAISLESEEAGRFMGLATEKSVRRGIEERWWKEPDDPWGLYTGIAGRAWGWAVLDKWAEVGGTMAGYNDV